MNWSKFEKAAEQGPMDVFWYALPRLLIVLIVLSAFGGVISVIGFLTNPLRQAGRVIEKTVDADNMIANYEWFKQRHEDITALESKIRASDRAVESFEESAGPRSEWHREDREEHARLSSVRLGLEQQHADIAAEYNARSRMANRSIFKAGDVELPESIDPFEE